jgi:hypothetical protein
MAFNPSYFRREALPGVQTFVQHPPTSSPVLPSSLACR